MKKPVNILFIMPLPLPYNDAVRWEPAEGGYSMNIHFVEPGLPNGPLSISAYINKFLPETKIKIFDTSAFLLRQSEKVFKKPLAYSAFIKRCLEFAKNSNPGLVLFSCMFNGTFSGLDEYSAAAAEMFPDAFIAAGGHLAAALPERILKECHAIQAICFGEGEIPLLGLCRTFALNGKDSKPTSDFIDSSPSWITRKKISENFKPSHEFIDDLDTIPPYNLDILYFCDDFLKAKGFASYIFRKKPFEGNEIMMFPTRGCPNRCIFCASQNVHGHKVRRHSIERVKRDILLYNRKHGVRHFIFFDDSFLYDRKSAVEILNFIGDNGWEASVPTPAFFAIDDEVAAAFAHAGVQAVEVNVESGNEETLRNIVHKPGSLERAEETVKHLRQHGILSIGSVLLGFPGENIPAILKGLARLKEIDMDMFMVWVATPLPGSEMWDICIKNSYFSGDLMNHYSDPAIQTPQFSKISIKYLYHSASKILNYDNNRHFRKQQWKEAYEDFQNPLFKKSFITEYYLALCAKKMGKENLFMTHKGNFIKRKKQETEGDAIYSLWCKKELPEIE